MVWRVQVSFWLGIDLCRLIIKWWWIFFYLFIYFGWDVLQSWWRTTVPGGSWAHHSGKDQSQSQKMKKNKIKKIACCGPNVTLNWVATKQLRNATAGLRERRGRAEPESKRLMYQPWSDPPSVEWRNQRGCCAGQNLFLQEVRFKTETMWPVLIGNTPNKNHLVNHFTFHKGATKHSFIPQHYVDKCKSSNCNM